MEIILIWGKKGIMRILNGSRRQSLLWPKLMYHLWWICMLCSFPFAGRDSWEPCNKVNVMLRHFDNLFLKCCCLYCFSPFAIPVFLDLTESCWLQSKERELCVVALKRERLIPESNAVTNCSTNCKPESRLVSEREGGFSVKLSPEITAVPAATLIPVLWETCYHRNPAKSRLNLWFSVTRMTNTACGKWDVKASFWVTCTNLMDLPNAFNVWTKLNPHLNIIESFGAVCNLFSCLLLHVVARTFSSVPRPKDLS